MSRTPSEVIRKILPGIGLQQIKNSLSLARRENQSRSYPAKSTCFLTLSIDINRGPVITFRHRLEEHFGKQDLSFQDFVEIVHPSWAPFYLGSAEIAYKISTENPEWPISPEACYSIFVPLRKHDNQYYWYQQFSFPAYTDPETGMLAAHFNCYHELGPYENFRPSPPSVYAKFPDPNTQIQLQKKYETQLLNLEELLIGFLSPKQKEIIRIYSEFASCSEKQLPSLKELHDALDNPRSMEAVKRARTRLTEALRDEFGENSLLANPESFVHMLNEFFKKSPRDKQ